MWFLSDFTFQARVKGTVQAPQNYANVGFGDGRHGRPKAAWETLRVLAESGGVMASTRTAAEWPKLEIADPGNSEAVESLLQAHG
jgi:hypothetical protein